MYQLKNMQLWWLTGTQDLYGSDTIAAVEAHTRTMIDAINQSGILPCTIVAKPAIRSEEDVTSLMLAANADYHCLGIITWMHTFSPSKMWMNGLALLQRPLCHFHTQFNRQLPWDEIDMDFMNLNQSAHGDREHGFIGARLKLPRKIIVGYWEDEAVLQRLASWARTAYGVYASRSLRVMRFGDNMRQVAVTEGDKIEAQRLFGWSVNTVAVGDLAQAVDNVPFADVDREYDQLCMLYQLATDDIEAVKYQARLALGMQRLLDDENCHAFTNTFEDLYGLYQLPGLASQQLLANGYGFGAEGDWKTAAMTAVMKAMSQGQSGGTAFMEDYTYDLTPGEELVLGAHMLEVCPSIASEQPRIEVHPLGIGGKNPPARLVFDGHGGDAIAVSLVDLGGRFRLIVQDIQAVQPPRSMPKLPVARMMWRPMPSFHDGLEAWLLCGGAHHTTVSFDVTAEQMLDWAENMGIEAVHLHAGTTLSELRQTLLYADLSWRLRGL